MKKLIFLSVLSVLGFSYLVEAKEKYTKTQEINFENVEVDGLVRKPEGAYLVQKRGVDFVPLYKVRDRFDQSIKESLEYLR
ncbi:MAG: hypothetical protein COT74_06570 [Bdellovibrionales bacterium CG10_big_fil_rev_8_21_14_0_10_45_34]|nr:MAG: hypothetical protein COT74_06570 [Bdellovibrionales bacterium CG10_big_fil_rev_8_21_14_0_10_45_34]